jgi:hypothetical protein
VRLAGTSATANAVHPGLVITNIIRYIPAWQRALVPLVKPFLRGRVKSLGEGAATTCYVATHPSLATTSGAYFADCAIARPEPVMEDSVLAAKLWQVSEELARNWIT